jgi:hypothetical protein
MWPWPEGNAGTGYSAWIEYPPAWMRNDKTSCIPTARAISGTAREQQHRLTAHRLAGNSQWMQTVLQSRGVAVAIALLLYIQPKTSSSAVRRWRLIVVTSIYAGLGIRLAGANLMYAREKEKIKVQLACEGNLWPQAHEREKEKRGGKFVAQTHVRERETCGQATGRAGEGKKCNAAWHVVSQNQWVRFTTTNWTERLRLVGDVAHCGGRKFN